MLSNGDELASGSRQPQQQQQQTVTGVIRSKDDEMVAYLFQRPQAEAEQYTGKRWPVGDDMLCMEQARTVSDIEREFHSMTFSEKNEVPNPKKLWQDDKGTGVADCGEHMFSPGVNPWTPQQESWPSGRMGPTYPREFGLGAHHRMRTGFPGNNEQLLSLSPRSSETGVLGVNMAEYVLGGAPVVRDRDPRLLTMKGRYLGSEADKMRGENAPTDCTQFEGEAKPIPGKDDIQNGVIQSGVTLSRPFGGMPMGVAAAAAAGQQGLPPVPFGGFPKLNPGSLSAENMLQMVPQPQTQQQQQQVFSQPPVIGNSGLTFDAPPFEPIQIDPFHIDYANQMMHSTESPNFGFDYSQQLAQQHQQQQQQRQQQPVAMLAQQQYAMAAQQQQQLGVPAYASAPYIINPPDAYGMQIPGPPVVPQYYSTQPPWGIYLAAPVQQQQQQPQGGAPGPPPQAPTIENPLQQLLRGQNARPLTPQSHPLPGQAETMAMQSAGLQLHSQGGGPPPSGFQILTPAFYDQSGQFIVGGGRGLGTPMRLVSPAPILVNTATGQQGYAPASGLFTPVSSGLFNPVNSTPLSLTPQQSGYGGAFVGSSTPSASLGSVGSMSQIGRDLFGGVDYKPRPFGQYYGTVAAAAMSPNNPMGFVATQNQSLTPPPMMSATSSNIPLAGLGLATGQRMYSSAPGAENKFRSNTVAVTNGLLVQSLLNPRPPAFMKGMPASKEAAGRSQLLEDFRNNQVPNLQLKDLVGHIVEFSQDQHGSRFIQQKLERATPTEKSMVFNEILTSAYSLMTDVFGNYVIQKFFEFGTQEQKQMLAQRIRGHVLPLALQMYGCRIIQKALESIPSEMQVEIVKELDGHVQKCVKDQNGNHVVQKCIECVDSAHVQFIIDAFKGQVLNLSTHPYGCRIIQRILEHCTPEQTTPILEELHQQTERLLMDQYGNYVIQHVLEHGRAEDRSRILGQVKNKVLILSQHKFASNVMEKCVSHASRTERAALIEEVCTTTDGQNCPLHAMMKDQYANYVVQRMIDVADPPQRKQLIIKLRPHVAVLRKYTYGKHILAKLEKYYMKNNSDLPPIGVSTNGVL